VRDEQHRLLPLLPDALQIQHELFSDQRVEGAERLVHQEHGRIVDEGTADAHSLLIGFPTPEAFDRFLPHITSSP